MACLTLRPPREEGRDAFSQAQFDKGQPARSDRASLVTLSNLSKALQITAGGQVLSR